MNKYLPIALLISILLLFIGCQAPNNTVKAPVNKGCSVAKQDYIGLSVDEAQALAKKNKTPFRVVKQDGEDLAVTMDFVTGRINAVVEKGKIIRYTVEGKKVSYDQHSWKDIIDESCQSFFDGCNNCQRIAGKSDAACTRKMCQAYEKPRCLDK